MNDAISGGIKRNYVGYALADIERNANQRVFRLVSLADNFNDGFGQQVTALSSSSGSLQKMLMSGHLIEPSGKRTSTSE